MQQPHTTPPRVEMINITKTYGSIRSLRGVNLELAPGEVLGLVGDNGAGKSTLTKVLSGAVIPSGGTIRIDGEQQQFANPADSRRCHIEMVYQDLSLCDTVDVAGNLFMGREPMKSVLGIPFLDEAKMHADAREMLKGLGISIPDTRLLVRNLSGGQRQAIAIARAAAFDPKVLIMDEPTAALATSNFLTGTNWLNIIRQSAPLLIVATAMTLVITTGGIDLSVGSTLALVGALSAIALNNWGLPWPVVLLGGLLLGGIVGAINGFFIAYEGIPAFIVTLATLAVVRGIALLVTQGYSIPVPADSLFTFIGRAWVVGIPMPALIGIMILLIGHIVLNHMRFGRYVTAIGANAEGARRSGINTKAVTMKVYIISGMAAALAGMIITARLGSGSSNQGEGFELQVIAAVVLGSTSLFGGFGTIIGTLLGALSIAVIQNGLILSHISPFYTQIATGTIILLAIWLNTRILNPARSAAKG